jgi:hypothetical protein
MPEDRVYYEETGTDAEVEEQSQTNVEVLNGALVGLQVTEAVPDEADADENTTESEYLNGYQGDALFEALLQGNSKLFTSEPYGWYSSGTGAGAGGQRDELRGCHSGNLY